MGRKKNSGLISSLFDLTVAVLKLTALIAVAVLRLAAKAVSGLVSRSESSGEGEKPQKPPRPFSDTTARQNGGPDPFEEERKKKFEGLTFATAPGADDPNRPRRGRSTLPGYDEPPCTKCGKGVGKSFIAIREIGSKTVHVLCGRCWSNVPASRYYGKNPKIERLGGPPEWWQRSHLPKHDGPPTPCTTPDCSKCGREIKIQDYEVLWLPTNEFIRLCPSCNSKMWEHDGWLAQVGDYR